MSFRCFDGGQSALATAEAMAAVVETLIEDRVENLEYGLLNDAVNDVWDAKPRDVTHLGHDEDAFVALVVAGDTTEGHHLLGCVEALQVELAQAPELHTAGSLRVDVGQQRGHRPVSVGTLPGAMPQLAVAVEPGGCAAT